MMIPTFNHYNPIVMDEFTRMVSESKTGTSGGSSI
jgi:hypothetical protein